MVETFSQFGKVTGCVVYQLRTGESPPTWALVAFDSEEAVEKCLVHSCHSGSTSGHVRHPPRQSGPAKLGDAHIHCTEAQVHLVKLARNEC
jgi:hypothetical protein